MMDGSGARVGQGGRAWFVWDPASRGSGRVCGSCLGEMASESLGRWAGIGGNDKGKAKLSNTGSEVPRISSIGLGVGPLALAMPHKLRLRSTDAT